MPSQKDMQRFNQRLAAVEEHLRDAKGIHVEYVEILSALMEAMGEKNPEVICAMELSEAELIARLEAHRFDAPRILGSIEAPDLDLHGSLGRVYAALNRAQGVDAAALRTWEILSHPSDPFPSDPCAHNESEDLVLDLATGALYHDRQCVHRLFRKDLAGFRARIAGKYPDLALPDMAAA